MGSDTNWSGPEQTQPDTIARHPKTVVALIVLLAVAQIERAQAIPGNAMQIVMH